MAVRQLPRSVPLRLLEAPRTAAAGVWRHAHAASRVARARAGYAAGVALAAWGVGVQFGLGWALMTAGLITSVSFLLLYPVDTP